MKYSLSNYIKMKKSILSICLAALMITTFISCKKNGIGGDNSIAAFPKHHSKTIPNAMVYIKYGATEFPGDDVSKYDDSKVATREGTIDAHAHFSGLLKGDYFIYAVGYDSAINQTVKGGITVKITTKAGEQDIEIPVTE
jgi:hypothetical protein